MFKEINKCKSIEHIKLNISNFCQPLIENLISSTDVPLCSHIMANDYFRESIMSPSGFYGFKCSSYFQYLFGWCGNESKIVNEDELLMGEDCPHE